MGLAAEGEQLIADLDAADRRGGRRHPQLDGKRRCSPYIDPTDLSQIGFYTTHDTRPGFLERPRPDDRRDRRGGVGRDREFYVTGQRRDADPFADVDIFVTYGDADGES